MSLRASNKGIHLARTALTSLGLTQELVMARVGCSRQPVSNFFNGNPVSRNIFVEICNILNLDWQQIADRTQVSVNRLRNAVKTDIETRCGTMRILDMTQPIGLSDIYTRVNILEKIIGRRRRNIAELLQDFNFNNFQRFSLGRISDDKLGCELHQKLQQLINQLPNPENEDKFKQWWQINGEIWTDDLRVIMIQYRNIGHDWQFSDEQKKLLRQYYFANQLLTQCLHRECYVSREVRQKIEETLLLPISEIEKRRSMGTI